MHSELIAALEKATGPDRELDAAIFWSQVPDGVEVAMASPIPAYTASIDAALTLVPEGYVLNSLSQTSEAEKQEHTGSEPLPNWTVSLLRQDCAGYRNRKRFKEAFKYGEAAKPALAIAAAALRAKDTTHD
jgi:hypothetical protein